MAFSVLTHLFGVERHHQRITRSATASGFATPALGEIQLRSNAEDLPLLATNMRGTFLRTRKSREHTVRFGFSPCPVEDEGVLVAELARILWAMSDLYGWGIRCSGVPIAVEALRSGGLVPRTVVVSSQLARSVLGQEEAPPEGLAGVVDQMQVLVTTLPENVALVATAPVQAGTCTRVGDSIGVLVHPLSFRVVQT